jgi:hypothetical protein
VVLQALKRLSWCAVRRLGRRSCSWSMARVPRGRTRVRLCTFMSALDTGMEARLNSLVPDPVRHSNRTHMLAPYSLDKIRDSVESIWRPVVQGFWRPVASLLARGLASGMPTGYPLDVAGVHAAMRGIVCAHARAARAPHADSRGCFIACPCVCIDLDRIDGTISFSILSACGVAGTALAPARDGSGPTAHGTATGHCRARHRGHMHRDPTNS